MCRSIKTPVYDAAGRVIGTQGIFWDITEKFRAESTFARHMRNWPPRRRNWWRTMSALKLSHEELIQAQLQLIQAEKMESVGRLAAGVAHEVKNPLAIILMGLEYLTGTCALQLTDGDSNDGDGTITTVIHAMRDAVSGRTDRSRAGGFFGQPPARSGVPGLGCGHRAIAAAGEA